MPPASKPPKLRPPWQLVLNIATGAAVTIWVAATVLLFIYPDSSAWLWTTLVSILALGTAAFAVIKGRQPPKI